MATDNSIIHIVDDIIILNGNQLEELPSSSNVNFLGYTIMGVDIDNNPIYKFIRIPSELVKFPPTRQPGVDTYNDTSDGKTSLLNSYPTPEKGWTVLVRHDETNGGVATLYQWNDTIWVNLETVLYQDDVATLNDIINLFTSSITEGDTTHVVNSDTIYKEVTGGGNKTLKELDEEKAEKNLEDGSKVLYVKETEPADGDMLVRERGVFVNKHLSNIFEEQLYYGVEWDENIADTAMTRIGNPALHQSLPIHNKMRGCLLLDDGTVNKYLGPNDWTGETLDGSLGQVMVEIPEHYRKFEIEGTVRRVKISEYQLSGFNYVPLAYRSAYEAAIDRTTSGSPKLASVVNATAAFRGGQNTDTWDGTYRSLLGRPGTATSLTNFRTYARRRGSTAWNCDVYEVQKTCYWLFAIEYANLNCQLPYNAAADANGYKQGGLGGGVSNLEGTKWVNLNSYNPFVPCGTTNSLGNKSGYVTYTMPFEYDANGAVNYLGEYNAATAYAVGNYVSSGIALYRCILASTGNAVTNATYFTAVTRTTTNVPRYRGLENPYGHLWSWTDGCKCFIQSDASGGLSEFYVCDTPANFTSSGVAGYELRGYLPRVEGYVKKIIVGEYGENMPAEVGGSSTTYFSDYFYTDKPETGVQERAVLFGGYASTGAYAGFVFAATTNTATDTAASIGSRLCFIPA